MLHCARSCIGKKLKHLPAVCAEPQPYEPLLFLYPRWFQEVARDTHSVRTGGARKFSTKHKSSTRASAGSKQEGEQYGGVHSHEETRGASTTPSHVVNEPVTPLRGSKALSSSSLNPRRTSISRPFDQALAQQRKKKNPNQEETHLQRERQKQRTAPYHSQSLDGLELARRLSCIRPERLVISDTVQLEAKFLRWLTGTSEENKWKHHDGTGCVVHVKSGMNYHDTHREVILTGTERAREIVAEYLMNLQDEFYQSHNDDSNLELANNSPVALDDYVRVDQLPRPSTWSLRTFAEYVSLVVSARAPRSVERIFYPGKEKFKVAAAGILMDIFSDPQLYSCQSSLALRKALEFFSTKTDIANYGKYVWNAARQAGITPDIACFNLEISKFIKVGNVLSMRRLISEMEETHTQPDIITWGYLFKLTKPGVERNAFLRLQNNQHALHEVLAKESMIQALVESSFEPTDKSPESVSAFDAKMRGIFGDEWLTPPVLQCMIEKSTKAGTFQTLSKLVKLAGDTNILLDTDSFTVLFRAVIKSGWFEDVQKLLELMPEHFDSYYRHVLIERAFREAWRQRLANTARVLWHYAASHGSIRYTMLMKVAKTLTDNTHTTSEHIAPTMAAVIVGTDHSSLTTSLASDSKEHTDVLLNLVASLKQWQPEGLARHDQMQQSHALLESDLTVWQRVEPMQHTTLMELLRKAFEQDLAWHQSQTMTTTPLLDVLKQAIQVMLIPRETPIIVPLPQPSNVDRSGTILTTSLPINESGHTQSWTQPSQSPNEVASIDMDTKQEQRLDEEQFYATNFSQITECSSASHHTHPAGTIAMPIVSIPLIDLVLHHLGMTWSDD